MPAFKSPKSPMPPAQSSAPKSSASAADLDVLTDYSAQQRVSTLVGATNLVHLLLALATEAFKKVRYSLLSTCRRSG